MWKRRARRSGDAAGGDIRADPPDFFRGVAGRFGRGAGVPPDGCARKCGGVRRRPPEFFFEVLRLGETFRTFFPPFASPWQRVNALMGRFRFDW